MAKSCKTNKKSRSSCSEVFYKRFPGKNLCWSLFYRVTGLGPLTLLKKAPAQCFHLNFVKLERLFCKTFVSVSFWKSCLFEFSWTTIDKNLLEEFIHIWTTNFAILFSSKNIKREKGNFSTMPPKPVFFTQEIRSFHITLIFFFLWYYELSLYKLNKYAWIVHRWIVNCELAKLVLI